MGRGAAGQAKANTATGQQYSSDLMNMAGPQGVAASKFFTNELNNPQGFSPQELAAMATSSEQSLGGSQAGALGAGNLLAARTGNNAGLTTAMDQSARNNAQQASTNALGIQNANTNLKNQQQQGGASGLAQLYGTNLQESLGALGLSNSAIQAWTAADAQTTGAIEGPIEAAMGAAGSAAQGSIKCWVAAELYNGWFDPRTILLRQWIFDKNRNLGIKTFAWVYAHTGKQVAKIIHHSKTIRKVVKFIFDKLLLKAQE